MKTVSVHIKELDKGGRELTLQNLRDEVVGYLYRDTIARSTRADMQFYMLLFFAAIPSGDKTSLEAILDDGIPKFDALNKAFQHKQGYLRANEYHEMVVKYGLIDLFYKDLFFVISDGVLNIREIEVKFADFLMQDPALAELFYRLKSDYQPRLRASFDVFQSSRIQDDRVDDNGNYHDLSKSVYRTVRMRSSRNLELNLQKYTKIQKIESNSPVDFTFLQYIDPNILIDLWDKYHVATYMVNIVKGTWNIVNQPLPSAAVAGLIIKYLDFKRINGNENRKEKNRAKQALDSEKILHNDYLEKLNTQLTQSILDSNKRLEADIRQMNRERLEEAQKAGAVRDKELIESLNERIEKLENLQVETQLDDDDNPQTKIV